MRSLLLDVGGRNDLSGEVEPFAEVIETLGGQGVVVVLPRELGLDIAAGGERLASLDNEQVLGVDIGVLGEVEVLLGDEDTLTEEVLPECQFLNNSNRSSVGGYLVDLLAVGLGNQHRGGIARKGSMLEGGSFLSSSKRSEMVNYLWAETLQEIRKWGGFRGLWLTRVYSSRDDKIAQH